MSTQLINLFKLSGSFLALFATAEYLYRQIKLSAETTRKIVHVGGGLIALSFPFFFKEVTPVFLLCGSFFMILVVSKKLGGLPSINAIDRNSQGSFLFPIAVAGSFYTATSMTAPALFYLPLLIMIIGDPIACIVGKRFPIGAYTFRSAQKTLAGSSAFFITAFLLTYFFLTYIEQDLIINTWGAALCIALGTSVAEGITGKGYDNITIPLTAALILMVI